MNIRIRIFGAALIVSVLLAIPFYGSASSMAEPYMVTRGETKYFKDVSVKHPFLETIGKLKEKGLIKGYEDGTFAPDSTVSRAEFITMVMASVVKNPKGADCFADVKGHWSERFVCAAQVKGLVKGYTDGTFKPNNNINFAEASVIFAKANRLNPKKAGASEPWYKSAVEKLAARSAIPTSIDYFEKKLSRAETGEIIWRLKSKIKNRPSKSYDALTAEVPKISSCAELKEKFMAFEYKRSKSRVLYLEGADMAIPMLGLSPSVAMKSEAIAAESSDAGAPAPSSGTSDYSSTNVQVAGVDEADIIKNDGGFIYIVSRSTVRIVKATPPDAMAELAKVEFSDKNFQPSELYVTENKLVVLGTTWTGDNEFRYGSSRAKVFIFAMDEARNLTEERIVEFDGYTLSSRRIGNFLYLVVNDTPGYYHILQPEGNIEKELPYYFDSKVGSDQPVVGCSDIRFIPRSENANFLVVASVNLSDPAAEVDREVIMGGGKTVYSSLQNLYVAGTRYEYPEVEKFDIWMPPTQNEKTVFFQFGLFDGNGNPDVSYKGRGEVQGHLLNQFSMDESGDAFRVAVTTGDVWNMQNKSKNHLYMLDKNDLKTVLGKIENIAPGEKIYSVRFLGKRAYMVTFKKIDPFFVIDVEDPRNPKILGELKIPGYSDYLHPFDENHIIGFGKEAVDPQEIDRAGLGGRGFDFAWYQGMKIALFDVTDVANPKVLFKEMVGDRGTESEILQNHKALLYDKERNLFAFPVTVAEVKNKTEGSYTGSQYGETTFIGAYIYTLDLEKGFQLKGKASHYEGGLKKTCQPSGGIEDIIGRIIAPSEYCWVDQDYTKNIQRILYIGDHFYTVSPGMVKALKREDVAEVKSITLQDIEEEPPVYMH